MTDRTLMIRSEAGYGIQIATAVDVFTYHHLWFAAANKVRTIGSRGSAIKRNDTISRLGLHEVLRPPNLRLVFIHQLRRPKRTEQ